MRLSRLRMPGVLPRLIAAFCLLTMLVAGRFTYKDYGFTVDEAVERSTCLINYQYIVHTLFGQDLNISDQPLETYKDRHYGVALQLPMVVLEHITGFTMPLRDVFLFRHLWTFLVCLSGWVCFYLFLEKILKSRWLSLLGFLMLALYPRFWGEQFTNIKDLVFTATCCYALLGTVLCLEHEGRWLWETLGAFLFALCANTRIIGLVFPLLLLGYRVLRDGVLAPVWKERGTGRFLLRCARHAASLLLFLLFYMLITPAAWTSPLKFLGETLGEFSDYNVWPGTVYFLGNQYSGSGLPWYYLPVWLGVSVPLWYLLAMLVGIAQAANAVMHNRRELCCFLRSSLLGRGRWFVLCLIVAVLPVAAAILMHSTLYNGWRHMYFLFPEIVVLAVFGIQRLFRLLHGLRLRCLVAGGMALLLAGQICWTVWMHPFEKLYFNFIGRAMADHLETDYWYESCYSQVMHILEADSSHRITLSTNSFSNLTVNNYLYSQDSERFYFYPTLTSAVEYTIEPAWGAERAPLPGFTAVYALSAANGLPLSILYLRDDVLMERFGGQWPKQN